MKELKKLRILNLSLVSFVNFQATVFCPKIDDPGIWVGKDIAV